MNSLFAQLRESRAVAMSESAEEEKKVTMNEGAAEPGATETPAEETPAEETPVEEEVEEVSALFCSECGALISGYMNESEVDECPCCGSEELVEKVVKVVRDGKIVKKKVRTGAKPRMSVAQKAALAKARKKAHTAAASKKRAKSLKKGAAAGLHEDDLIVCPECGYEGEANDFDVDEEGKYICPECGAVCESCGGKKHEETKDEGVSDADVMATLLEQVGAPDFVKNALVEGKNEFVASYLNLKMGK